MMVLTDEEFRNTSKEELAAICNDDWKPHVEYDLVFSDLRTNEIYVSVSFPLVSFMITAIAISIHFLKGVVQNGPKRPYGNAVLKFKMVVSSGWTVITFDISEDNQLKYFNVCGSLV